MPAASSRCGKPETMTVLLTEAGSPLGLALAAQLGSDVRLTDRPDAAQKAASSTLCSFLPDEATDALVEGVDTLVHLTDAVARSCTDVTDTTWLDGCIRDTYNLLRAASRAGVKKCVLVSTLDVFLPYPADIDCLQEGGNTWPGWKPLPSCDPEILGPHMAEFVAREFAHAGALRIANIRLGTLDTPDARFSCSTAEAVEAICGAVAETPDEDPAQLGAETARFFSQFPCVFPLSLSGQFVDFHGKMEPKTPVFSLADWNDEGQRGFEKLNYLVKHVGIENPAAGTPEGTVDSMRVDTGGSVERSEHTVLLTGGNGMLGPPVIGEMLDDFTLRVTDVAPLGTYRYERDEYDDGFFGSGFGLKQTCQDKLRSNIRVDSSGG